MSSTKRTRTRRRRAKGREVMAVVASVIVVALVSSRQHVVRQLRELRQLLAQRYVLVPLPCATNASTHEPPVHAVSEVSIPPEQALHEVRWEHAQGHIDYANLKWATPTASVISAVANATVINPSGAVRNASAVYDFGKWYWKETATAKTASTTALSFPVLSLVQIYNYAFQHIAFDTLPKLSFCCPFLRDHSDVQVLVMNQLQQDLVQLVCPSLATNRFVALANNFVPVSAPIIYVPHFEPPSLPMGMAPPHSLQPLGRTTSINHSEPVVMYIPRKRGTKRSVANEQAVLTVLRNRWPKHFQVYHPTNDWRRDMQALAKTTVLIGPHGGALSNMIFCAPNATVIEFSPVVQYARANRQGGRPCYLGLANALGFNYHAVETIRFDFNKGAMVVDVPHLEQVLRLL